VITASPSIASTNPVGHCSYGHSPPPVRRERRFNTRHAGVAEPVVRKHRARISYPAPEPRNPEEQGNAEPLRSEERPDEERRQASSPDPPPPGIRPFALSKHDRDVLPGVDLCGVC
jgi:hypothetical protein